MTRRLWQAALLLLAITLGLLVGAALAPAPDTPHRNTLVVETP